MNSCSVRLTFANDDFYETFIEPRKINGDLPTLILRLLTAYAFNDNLAVEIDEYLDSQEDESSGVVQTRQAILNAIAHMNSINSVLESSDRALSDLDNTSAPQEAGTSGDISDIPMFTPDDKPVQANNVASDYSEVMKAIGALTGQVSSLTTSVSALVSGIKTGAVLDTAPETPLEPVDAVPEQTEAPVEPVSMGTERVDTPVEPAKTGIEQTEIPAESAKVGTEQAEIPETQETGTAQASDEDEDDIFVPDFMSGMIESVNS